MSESAPFQVTVHPYQSPTPGSCAYEQGDSSAPNALVFIGGLTDGPHTTAYIRVVARHLAERKDLGYSVFEIRMRSSFIGFGTSSLMQDVDDISALVRYLRGIGRKKIVLMGHSTGTQDCMEYANYERHGNEPVDGFILQAPVSDREPLDEEFPTWRESLQVAEDLISEGKEKHLMPVDKVPAMLGAPMTAYRFWSLVAPGGDDDYFTSTFDDETVSKIWGRFNQPVCVLHSEKDKFVPKSVDALALNKRYQNANPKVSALSGLIPGTGHAVEDESAREWVAQRVQQFLEEIASN